MTAPLPILDRKPSGKPHDWNWSVIQLRRMEAEKVPEVTRPTRWKNPNVRYLAPRDQAFRGTCVGQSFAYAFDLYRLSLCPGVPTAEDIAQFKKDVVDSIGTTHDILYPQSASAEAFYQMSRKIGGITYPSGSETRFAARAWRDFGAVPETMWHTDKTGKAVWVGEPRPTIDGGVDMATAAGEAAKHTSTGWAIVGDEYGNATFDQICDAIYQSWNRNKSGFVIAGIPIYENYSTMAGGDGSFPLPRGSIAGYHALCFYGYDEDTLYLLHSWGDWCGMFGSVPREYTNSTVQESVYVTIIDDSDVEFAKLIYRTLKVTVRNRENGLPITAAKISVDGRELGFSPQRFAVEKGIVYQISAEVMGYMPQKIEVLYESQEEIDVLLNPVTEPKETFWKKVKGLLTKILSWIRGSR